MLVAHFHESFDCFVFLVEDDQDGVAGVVFVVAVCVNFLTYDEDGVPGVVIGDAFAPTMELQPFGEIVPRGFVEFGAGGEGCGFLFHGFLS